MASRKSAATAQSSCFLCWVPSRDARDVHRSVALRLSQIGGSSCLEDPRREAPRLLASATLYCPLWTRAGLLMRLFCPATARDLSPLSSFIPLPLWLDRSDFLAGDRKNDRL